MPETPRSTTEPSKAKRADAKPVALALQGGGAHGAFTWGVLDKLLEDDRLSIEAMSATSAGAMNAVVMAHGYSLGGIEGARAKLAEFWKAISDFGTISSLLRPSFFETWFQTAGAFSDLSPAYYAFQAMTQMFSPYQFNPLNFNPLRDVLTTVVDFEHLKACPITARLYLSATNVRTGKIKIFENKDLSPDAVLASACLPYLFQAIEIDGEHYWDGGYMGNPAIFPLIYRPGTRDVVIVHINPIERPDLPRTAPEILDRINEISFNSSLLREMRAIAFVSRLIAEGRVETDRYSRMLIHSISDDTTMQSLGVASKLDPDWDFLCTLRDAGRRAAAIWLDAAYDDIGNKSSVDLAKVYL